MSHILTPAPRRADPAHAAAHRRGLFLKWLRKTHSWIGLWGALLGLLFGLTGFFQNHRAVMRIDTGAAQVSDIRLELPVPPPATPQAMAAWLQQELKLPKPPERIQRDPAKPVAWGDRTVTQPEHWQLRFRSPTATVQAEYWAGAGQVNVRRVEPGLLAVLENLHKSNGVTAAWVLIADTIAGGMVLLSITGVLLWTGLNRRRTVGAAILGVSLLVTLALAAQTL
ncbi:PepSY-associated TM helix domain-containing protein [Bordetella genomosp. 11]|uniref:Peptidase n=1 Tax=Bordetella genomosp. 11 TaxID=1416808 RepID=A0A261UKR8_9BORD|nr:PepSY-associated TM helix domain-containing protein [Bordetella genomosp. 11]OZI62245.1 peptidase [Bordetella genomosp. 11]